MKSNFLEQLLASEQQATADRNLSENGPNLSRI